MQPKSICSEKYMLGMPCVLSKKGPSTNFVGSGKGFFPGGSPARYLVWKVSVYLRDPRSGMTPKWGFGVAMLPVDALCFYQVQFGCTMLKTAILGASLLLIILQCFRASQGMLPPGACRTSRASAKRIVLCRGGCTSSLCPQIPHVPAPTFGVFRFMLFLPKP